MSAETYTMSNCSVIILAAGRSSRLGQPKQLLKYQNKTLLQHAIDAAQQSSALSVVLVLGYRAEDFLEVIDTSGLYLAKNEDWQTGMASSVRSGISALQNRDPAADAAILMMCDQPFCTSDVLNKLLAMQQETGKAIIASSYGNTIGTPALFHKNLFPELLKLSGDAGAKKIIGAKARLLALVPFAGGSLDIDTLDDYAVLEK